MSGSIRDNPNRGCRRRRRYWRFCARSPTIVAGRQAVRFGDGLLYSILGMVAGANSYRQMHEFIRIHLQRLNGAFGLRLPYSPSYTGLRLILQGVDPRRWRPRSDSTRPHSGADPFGRFVGDRRRRQDVARSFDAFSDRKAARMMSALRQADQSCSAI